MSKQDFTPAGVSAKITELYALSDENLLIQANLVKSNLRTWMGNNFNLTTDQSSYLTNMDDRGIGYLQDNLSFCFIYRLSMSLIQPTPGTQPKYIHTHNSIITVTSDDGDFSATGGLVIEIVYS